jgi:hypothetical protein
LHDRLEKLRVRERELCAELVQQKNRRDRAKLRRLWMERTSVLRDVKVTENTLWTIERQLVLFERSDLDALVINSLKASTHALQEMASRGGYSAVDAEEITEALQQRMQEANELTDSVASVLQVGVDQDMDALDKDLQAFLDGDDTALGVDDDVAGHKVASVAVVPPIPLVMGPTAVAVAATASVAVPTPTRVPSRVAERVALSAA